MEEMNRLRILHQEEQAARARWNSLRKRRTELIVNARHSGIPARILAEATGLTHARIYNMTRGRVGERIEGDPTDLLRQLTQGMEQEAAAASALARQRNEVAIKLGEDGASAPFLAKTLQVNVDTLRNWLYNKVD